MSGSGLMFYSRSADDMFYPRTSAVRATQYMAAHQFIQVRRCGWEWESMFPSHLLKVPQSGINGNDI